MPSASPSPTRECKNRFASPISRTKDNRPTRSGSILRREESVRTYVRMINGAAVGLKDFPSPTSTHRGSMRDP